MTRAPEDRGVAQDGAAHTRVFVADLSYFEDRAAGLVSAHEAHVPQALAQIRTWHPAFAGRSDAEIAAAAFDADAARVVYARQHGCDDWAQLGALVHAIAHGQRREPFKDVFDALRDGRWQAAEAGLAADPELAWARGTNGNTLLNLAGSLAARARDVTANVWIPFVDRLIGFGAGVNDANDRGWTPLHQAAYSNQSRLALHLIAAGAAVDLEAHGGGGTPLAVALFWGNRAAADVIARAGIAPRNLRIAAGLGRVDLVEACFAADGALTADARSGRGFYRPHSGFPVWRPSNSRQEILDEALVWAAKADRGVVMPSLVSRGSDVNADPYRGTPLLWAAANGCVNAARWLVEHGADVNRRATFGGPSHGEGVTALHIAAQSDHVDIVHVLLAHGADRAITDRLYAGTPAGWAEHCGAVRSLALLR